MFSNLTFTGKPIKVEIFRNESKKKLKYLKTNRSPKFETKLNKSNFFFCLSNLGFSITIPK